MTTREFIQTADSHPWILTAAFVGLPLLAWICGCVHATGQGRTSPWKYIYALLVYAACIPGLFAAVLVGYSLFFTKENLLDASLLMYFLPIASMIATLVAIRRNVSFDDVPGFDRLSGLMVMLGLSFATALAIDRTRIWIWFGGSVDRLFLLAAGVFVLMKWGCHTLFRNQDEPRPPMPDGPLSKKTNDGQP